jgi:ElaB/YqjD/DUF883 family membrane-anchored ribosome-binding protein
MQQAAMNADLVGQELGVEKFDIVDLQEEPPNLLGKNFFLNLEKNLAKQPLKVIKSAGAEAFAPKDRKPLGALAADAAMQEAHDSATMIDSLVDTLDEAVHEMSTAAQNEIAKLRQQMRALEQTINKARASVKETSDNYRTFGEQISQRILAVSNLCNHVMGQCESIQKGVAAISAPGVEDDKAAE